MRLHRSYLAPGVQATLTNRPGERTPAAVACLFFAGVGAGSGIWRKVIHCFLAKLNVDCWSIDAPGNGHRYPRHCRVTVAEAAQEVCTWFFATDAKRETPYRTVVAIGHSAGGMLAHEVAKRLHARGFAVRVVFVNATLDSISRIVARPLVNGSRHPVKAARMARLISFILVPCRLLAFLLQWRPLRRSLKPFIRHPDNLTDWALTTLINDMSCEGGWIYLRHNRHYPYDQMATEIVWPVAFIGGGSDPLCESAFTSSLTRSAVAGAQAKGLPVPMRVSLPMGHCGPIELAPEVAHELVRFIGPLPIPAPAALPFN